MVIPTPESQFDRLNLPAAPLWLWRAGAGAGLLAASGAVALHHPWVGATLLVPGALLAGAGESVARRAGVPQAPILPLGLMLIPFGFALADPSRALAAMFLIYALSVLTVLGRGHVSVVTWGAAVVLLLACILPYHFSLLAYAIGVVSFMAAGQGAAKDWA